MILGLDLSLNHGGAVLLDGDGEVAGYWFATDKKTPVDRSKGRGQRSPARDKSTSPEQHQLNRLRWWTEWLEMVLNVEPEYAGIEGYAYGAASNSSYQYGELGGLARMALTREAVKLRVHDPLSVKMFATGKGNAPKERLVEALPADLREAWSWPDRTMKEQLVVQDLADAYWVARLVWSEVKLRAGEIALSDFESQKVRVFNRVTKAYPTNLLDREWML
jgi:Holliday junction resolvasome RuvABC endonuclease subunit